MSQSMRVKRIRVGDDAQAYCGRCKAERTHVIAAMKSDTEPAEVICRTCHTKHRFRAGARAQTSPGGTTPRARVAGQTSSRSTAREARRDAPARPYSTADTYAAGEWIEHPRHGVGRVAAVRDAKIDVEFDAGARTLLHAG